MIERDIVNFPIALLRAHPLNAKYYGAASAAEDESLRASLQAFGQRAPIVVCGAGCASPEGTILSGHRRKNILKTLGHTEVSVVLRDHLSDADEELAILVENKAAQEHRTLSEQMLHEQEERIAELLARRQGARSDLDPTKPAGETSKLVAEALGTNPGAVRARKKVFGSELSTPALQQAVQDGRLPRSTAANIVRKVEGDVKKGSLSLSDAEREIQRQVENQIRERSAPRVGGRAKRVDVDAAASSVALEAGDGGIRTAPSLRDAICQAKAALEAVEFAAACHTEEPDQEDLHRMLVDWRSALKGADWLCLQVIEELYPDISGEGMGEEVSSNDAMKERA